MIGETPGALLTKIVWREAMPDEEPLLGEPFETFMEDDAGVWMETVKELAAAGPVSAVCSSAR